MNTIDIVLAIVLGIGLIRGYFKGFIVEVTSLAGLILGVYGAIHFSYYLSDFLKSNVSMDESAIQLISFAGTFIIILIAISLLGKTLTKIADSIALGVLNKFLGAIFGLFKIALITSIVLLIFSKLNSSLPFVEEQKVEGSKLYEPIKNFGTSIFPTLIREVERTKENIH